MSKNPDPQKSDEVPPPLSPRDKLPQNNDSTQVNQRELLDEIKRLIEKNSKGQTNATLQDIAGRLREHFHEPEDSGTGASASSVGKAGEETVAMPHRAVSWDQARRDRAEFDVAADEEAARREREADGGDSVEVVATTGAAEKGEIEQKEITFFDETTNAEIKLENLSSEAESFLEKMLAEDDDIDSPNAAELKLMSRAQIEHFIYTIAHALQILSACSRMEIRKNTINAHTQDGLAYLPLAARHALRSQRMTQWGRDGVEKIIRAWARNNVHKEKMPEILEHIQAMVDEVMDKIQRAVSFVEKKPGAEKLDRSAAEKAIQQATRGVAFHGLKRTAQALTEFHQKLDQGMELAHLSHDEFMNLSNMISQAYQPLQAYLGPVYGNPKSMPRLLQQETLSIVTHAEAILDTFERDVLETGGNPSFSYRMPYLRKSIDRIRNYLPKSGGG